MRVALHEYAKGGHSVYETSDDGGEFLGQWAGPHKPGERLSAFIEVGCEGTPEGLNRLLQAIEWLTEEIKKRKAGTVSVAG